MNIIITGASRGIGFETAKLLSKEHKVMAVSRSAEKHKLPGVISISFDLEKGNIIKDLMPQIKKHFDKVDVLINNAATLVRKPFEKLSQEDFEKVYRVNVFSLASLTQAVLPMMKKGHVLNIASMGGIQGSIKFPGLSAYSSTKGAVITLTECLAEEYKNKNISFNAIAFGSVQTEMLEEAFPGFKAPITAADAAKFLADFAVS
jgi:NAD(P)-dependent dehydrogenase (short-subunit alcohol dehydrogenase family)